MIEIQYKNKAHTFSNNTIGQKLKQELAIDDCIGFYDQENGTIYDLHSQVHGPVALTHISKADAIAQKMLRASLAFILAEYIDGTLIDIEISDSGFAAKFLTQSAISENDFASLEKKMKNMIESNLQFEKVVKSYEESVDLAQEMGCQSIWSFNENDPNTWYKLGNIAMPCSHALLSVAKDCACSFKIQKVAQEDFKIADGQVVKVQKVSVAAFFAESDLEKYLALLELLKQNDHRLIGQNMELFYMIPEAAGSVFWLPRGWKLFKALENFIRRISYADYQEVRTPFVMSSSFWEKSGHMQAYGKNMMHINMGTEEHECAALKPMNCPGHIEIFKQKIRSYRDLPFRIAELGSCHRYEPSGSLHGLLRVRSFTMDDGHIFCAKEQIQSEVERFMVRALEMYKHFGFSSVAIKIATRPENFLGEIENWDYAEKVMQEAMKELKLPFEIAHGDGAFYGPKVEMHITDSMGRSWQLGTIQLDFVLPERFDISYVDDKGQKQRPCMLHRAMLGSMERFIAMLLEHTGGNVPLSLAPVQVAICSVVSDCNEYAQKVFEKLKTLGMNVELDTRNETLGAKIRMHRMLKVPMIAVIGKDEVAKNMITLEYANNKHQYQFDELDKILKLVNEI